MHHECPFHKAMVNKKRQENLKNFDCHNTPFYSEYLNQDGSPLAESKGVSTVVVDLFGDNCMSF